jgi:ubiquinone/menaquinone biosynthesis C-methylase UbiE
MKHVLRKLLQKMSFFKENSFRLFYPYMEHASSFVLRKPPPSTSECAAAKRVPPMHKWISDKYGRTVEEYLASGKRDLHDMEAILSRHGVSLAGMGNILEFGCGDGRMIRWLEDLAHDREIWGSDIHAERIIWCKQHISPPFRFVTTTIVPHLPFEDRYFGFIFAGSVFTHIDDLADAWLMELRRVLRPGGKLFITVHLKNDISLLNGMYQGSSLTKFLRSQPVFIESMNADFDVLTIGRSSNSYVFYDFEYLRKMIEPNFRILSLTERVRLYQNALLLERA